MVQVGICFQARFVIFVDMYVSATASLEDCYDAVDAMPGIGQRLCDGPKECLWSCIVETLPALWASLPIFRRLTGSPRFGSGVEVLASTQIHGLSEDRALLLMYMFHRDDEEVEDEPCCFLVMNPQEFNMWRVEREVWDIDIHTIQQRGQPYHTEFFTWINALFEH